MHTHPDLTDALDAIDWDDPRQCADTSRTALHHLAANPALLTDLVDAIGRDPHRLARCETHPIISRLSLAEDPAGHWALRLHVFTDGQRDLVPHDHKYPFAVHLLSGGYLHVWNRRTGPEHSGDFTSAELRPGIVTLEQPGTAYLLSHSLVHQTAVAPGTATLFLRGPARQHRWHAATDLHDRLNGFQAPPRSGGPYLGSAPMTQPEYQALTRALARRGIITTPGRTRP
jgi:hypothetical protein